MKFIVYETSFVMRIYFNCIREDGEVQRINNILYKRISIRSVLSAGYSNMWTLHVSCLIYT